MYTLTWLSPASSLLRCGACSVLLHVGALAMLGALPDTRPVDTSRPLVTVTLIEPPAPVPQDMPLEDPPPMFQAQRQEQPVAPHQVQPSPHQPHLPPPYPVQAMDIPPSPTRHSAPPVTRALFSDQRAADALQETSLETPPMLHAQRQEQPAASHQARPSSSQRQIHLPTPHPTQVVDIPPSPTRHATPTVTRTPLSDQHAADALQSVPTATPPMLHTQRQAQPVAPRQARLSPPRQLRLPPPYPARAMDLPPSPTRHAAPSVTRALLSDQRASDTLKLKKFTKAPARRTTSAVNATAVPQEEQPLVIANLNTTNPWSLQEDPTPSLPTTHTNTQHTSKVFRDGTVDRKGRTTVRAVKADHPPYPRTARERGWEGTVVLRLAITREGAVEQATIRTSSGFPLLDESARQTVQAWKFEPARDGEFAIPTKVDVPVRFSLDDRHTRDTP